MCKTTNILSELQGKKVKIDNRTQIITIEFNYSFKRNSNTIQITFNDVVPAPLGKRLIMVGYVLGCGKTLNDALYFLFTEPQQKQLSKKQEKVIQRAIKKFNKENK